MVFKAIFGAYFGYINCNSFPLSDPGRRETLAITGRLMPVRWFCTPALDQGHLGQSTKGNGTVNVALVFNMLIRIKRKIHQVF